MSRHRADVEPDSTETHEVTEPEPYVEPAPVETTIAPPLEPDLGDPLDSAIRVRDGLVSVADLDGYLHERFGHFLDDIERRLSQTRELERSIAGVGGRKVHAEDLNFLRHTIDGYTVTANSPSAGYIAWTSVHIMYAGVDYTIADGNTNLRYTWFVKPGSYVAGTPVTLSSSNTKPTLATGDAYVFINNGGTPSSALDDGGGNPVVGANSVDSTAIVAGAVGSTAIATGAVGSTQIATGAVGSTQIANNAVTATQLGNGAVGNTQLAANAVGSSNIQTGAVGSTAIANNAVTATQLANGAVGNTQLATNAVAAGNIQSGAVGSTQIATGAVGSTQIANGAVGSTQIANGAVAPAKLNVLQHVMF